MRTGTRGRARAHALMLVLMLLSSSARAQETSEERAASEDGTATPPEGEAAEEIDVADSAEAAEPTEADAPATPAPTPPRPPYTPPFTLRPAIAPNVVRIDNMIDASADGVAYAPVLTAAVRVIPDLSPLVRIGMATWAPSTGGDHSVFVNPLVGALYTPDVGYGLRPAFFAALTLPLGSGEGNPPSPADSQALAYGRRGRMSLDNALFATNYTTLILGAGLAWLYEGLVIQLDLTLLHGIGSRAPVREPYDDLTNFVLAFWIAYAVLPWLSVGAELRHQHFFDAPLAIRNADAMMPGGPTQEYQTSLGGGVRFRIPIEGSVAFLPAVSYNRGLNGWMWVHDDNVFQIDLLLAY